MSIVNRFPTDDQGQINTFLWNERTVFSTTGAETIGHSFAKNIPRHRHLSKKKLTQNES